MPVEESSTAPRADITHMRASQTAKPPVDEAEAATTLSLTVRLSGLVTARLETKKPPPIRELAFASLKAPLRPARALIDPTDASEEREASGR